LTYACRNKDDVKYVKYLSLSSCIANLLAVIIMENRDWLEQFRGIITAYNNKRQPDPFMQWFRQQEFEGYFQDTSERVLAVLIDARFDQVTTADQALENTIAVVKCGALRKTLRRQDIPLLTGTQYDNPETWTTEFIAALPQLRQLAIKITSQKQWAASWLLDYMLHEGKAPNLGVKTSRLAVRWLHELVSAIKIDMTNYKIPIDRLVYRVTSRLGIIDPSIDKYYGDDSPGDTKIQTFVRKAFPTNFWIVDEPLWSTGRKRQDRGHCYPKDPFCDGCMFQKICHHKFTEFDPAKVGMEIGTKSAIHKSTQSICGVEDQKITKQQAEFREFIEHLKQRDIHGEEYRQQVAQWNREHTGSLQ
jgi:hypothetical protein